MRGNWLSISSLLVAVVLFFAAIIFSNTAFTRLRFDLTENKLYTLTEGTRNILTELPEPITLRFFLSQEVATGIPAVATYAKRVRDMLGEYERYAAGNINLEVIDPEPFSEQEDQAQKYGLRDVPLSDGSASLYFGLAGTNSVDDTEIISFFSPDRQKLLEYDLTRLIYQLNQTDPPVVGLVSSVPLKGDFRMGQGARPSWLIIDQIERLFTVESVDTEQERIPENVDILMVVHPQKLSDSMLYAIDQFVLSGGRALVFVDPYMEAEARGRGVVSSESDLEPLFKAWGVDLVDEKIAADIQFAERVRYQQEQRQVVGEFPVWINVQPSHFNNDDVVTATLGNVFMATPGILKKVEGATTEFTPLIQTSDGAATLESALVLEAITPATIIEAYQAGNEPLTLAARVSGPVETAFPDGPPESEADDSQQAASSENAGEQTEESSANAPQLTQSTEDINAIVVADADLLHEQFWAQRQNLFGNEIFVPTAANADFVINALENLTGSNDLISVRSRGEFTRPFTRVADIRQSAEIRYRQKEKELLDRLKETEQALLELEQGKRNDQNQLMLTEEQRQEIQKFRNEKIRIRRDLRNVQHQLRKDIDALEGWLKFVNIGLLPLLIVFGAVAVSARRARQRKT